MEECDYVYDPINEGENENTRWECPHESHPDSNRCIFHMSEQERREKGIDGRQISERIKENLEKDTPNEYIGANIPKLIFSYSKIESTNTEPLKLNRSNIGRIDLTNSDFRIGLDISGSTVDGMVLCSNLIMEGKLTAIDVQFNDDVEFFEARINGGLDFSDSTFEDEAHFDEIESTEEALFEGVGFKKEFSMEASTLNGERHELDDKTSFSGAQFEEEASFEDTTFRCVDFSGVEFRHLVSFNSCDVEDNYRGSGATYQGESRWEECSFYRDAVFTECNFNGRAVFKGSEFLGESKVSKNNTNFEDATFDDVANFESSTFNLCNFENVTFRDEAVFTEAHFKQDAFFSESQFREDSNFDESRFYEDSRFNRCVFEGVAYFRGVEFRGDTNQIEDNVCFEGSVFQKDAEFDGGKFTTANFTDVKFGGECDFEHTEFTDGAHFEVSSYGDNKMYVDMTGAEIEEGRITQSEESVPYDLTRATLGDIKLTGSTNNNQLLDYFRFCLTEFDGFKFEHHHDYLERNNWVIHKFKDRGVDINYKEELNSTTIERTYLKAKTNAKAIGDGKAESEFSYKENRYNREKNKDIISDKDNPIGLGGKIGRTIRILENYTMDYTCGYGTNLPRIVGLLVATPIVFGLIYSLGGPFETSAGSIQSTSQPLQIVGQNIYYSFMSFTTIGYGDVSPVAPWSKFLASLEGILGAVFSALLIYTLSKGY